MTAVGSGTSMAITGHRFEQQTRGLLEHLARRPVLAVLALAALVLALDLAGNLRLPPLDRTEVVYAQTAKQMNEGGAWTEPRFQDEPKFEKPLAVLWLQGLSARLIGQVDQISGYRVPSIVGTILAVVFTCWGARRVFDAQVAVVGAALLATMLVVTVQATLAMPEALMLAATAAALWAMGRAYVAGVDGDVGRGNALVFWSALGSSVLVNVLTVPLIALSTALALIFFDRGKSGWLRQLVTLPGVLVFLALAALWPLMLWTGGTLDAALSQWREEGLHLLLGPQEMKWRVVPGLFVVFLLLGMFPAGLFLGPALVTAWRERTSPAIRFLIAWVAPYLLFLEVFTRKTPLYMVQAMLPPLAVLFAVWILRTDAAETDTVHARRWYRLGTIGWLLLVVGLVILLWVLPLLLKSRVSPLAVLLGVVVIALAAVTTVAMLNGQRLAAAAALVALAVAFNNLAIPVTFAGLRPVWVSSEIRAVTDALRPCLPGDVIVAGHTEPSAVFELGTRTVRVGDSAEAARRLRDPGANGLAVVSAAVRLNLPSGASTFDSKYCVQAYDFIKSCSLRFVVVPVPLAKEYREDAARCAVPARFLCRNVPVTPMIGRMCK